MNKPLNDKENMSEEELKLFEISKKIYYYIRSQEKLQKK